MPGARGEGENSRGLTSPQVRPPPPPARRRSSFSRWKKTALPRSAPSRLGPLTSPSQQPPPPRQPPPPPRRRLFVAAARRLARRGPRACALGPVARWPKPAGDTCDQQVPGRVAPPPASSHLPLLPVPALSRARPRPFQAARHAPPPPSEPFHRGSAARAPAEIARDASDLCGSRSQVPARTRGLRH